MKRSLASRCIAVLALSMAALAGCNDDGAGRTQPDPARAQATASASAQRRPVDADLMAFLSKARAAHHSADLAESKGELELAIKHVEAIPKGPVPVAGPEVVEVLADSYARIADLKSRVGLFDQASRDVERGLGHATEVTHFRGHLFEVRGLVEERRMKDLEGKGDQAGAEKARKAALDAFEQAIQIQDQVILQLLPDDPAKPAPSAPASAP